MVRYWIQMAKVYLNAEEGQGMVEYGLILALVSVAAIFIMQAVGTTLGGEGGIFEQIQDALTGA